LKTTPYSIPWGESVFATITAVNYYGPSVESLPGNGAIIVTVPDAPIDLENLPLITNANQIGLNWQLGLSDGGTPVIDFTLYYD